MFSSLSINPFKLFGLPVATVDLGVYAARKLWGLTKAAWHKLPKPESLVGKCIVYPIYGYIVIPGSIPYALVKLADFAGYGEEMNQLWQIFANMFGSLGWLALDTTIKAVATFLWYLFTLVTRL